MFSGYHNKTNKQVFWKNPYSNLVFNIIDTNRLGVTEENKIVCRDYGRISISSGSKYKVGTFTGYVSTSGTEVGFLGFAIGDDYDEIPSFPHGALLYKKSKDTLWNNYEEDDKICIRYCDIGKHLT